MRISKFICILLLTFLVSLVVPSTTLQQRKPYEGVEIVVALRSLPETDFIMARVGEFEAKTGIRVYFVLYPELELRERIVMDCATKAGKFNVIAIDNMYIPEFVENGWIVPLDDFIKSPALTPPEYNVTDIMEVYRGTNSYKGKLYAIPIYGETTQLMYYRTIFEDSKIKAYYREWIKAHYDEVAKELKEFGLDPRNIPKELGPPTTMEGLWTIAKFFTKKVNAKSPVDYGIAMRGLRGEGMNVYIWTGFLRAFGGRFFKEEAPDGSPISYVPAFNSAEGVTALKFYSEILRRFGPPGVASFAWDDVQTVFQTGKVAMIIDATNFLTRIENPAKSAIAGKIGYAPLPRGPAGRFPSIYTLGFAIESFSPKKKQEASWLFIQWATSRTMELKKALEGNIVSVTRKSVFMNPVFIDKFGKYPGWRESTVEGLEEALPNYRPRFPKWREMGNLIGIAVEEAIAGVKSPKEALDWAAAESYKILKETGYIKG